MTKINKHFLATGLVVLVGGLPAAAQARVDFNPGQTVPVAPPVTNAAPSVTSAAPSVTQLAVIERRRREQRPPAGLPATAASPAGASSFDWGDAGIAAGGTVLVLSAGAAAVLTGRRRRTQRPLAG